MGYKTLELTVISAKDLKNVNLIGKMDVYVVVSLSDDPKSKQKTPVHQDGGTQPSWNYTMRFTIDESSAMKPGKYLNFQLRHESSFGSDKDLGEVLVSLKELLDGVNGKDPNSHQFLTYQVRRSSGKAQGELKFSVKFIDLGSSSTSYKPPKSSTSSCSYAPPPPAAYPPAPVAYPPQQPPPAPVAYPPQQPPPAVPYVGQQGYPQQGYPPQGYPQQGYPPQGYNAPPPYGGYPPPPGAGYGYPPAGGYYAPPMMVQKPQKPKKNNFGMGLGAGLIGGAIGGLVLGEVVDDIYDSGYDNGFDDGGGFDF